MPPAPLPGKSAKEEEQDRINTRDYWKNKMKQEEPERYAELYGGPADPELERRLRDPNNMNPLGLAPEGYGMMPEGMYEPRKASFDGPAMESDYWLQQAKINTPSSTYVDANRYRQALSRQNYESMLPEAQRYATGELSTARQEAVNALMSGRQKMAYQYGAGAPTQANSRAAIMGMGELGAQVGGQVAGAGATERNAAQAAYLQATGKMREQDLQQRLAEQEWYTTQSQHELGKTGMRGKYLDMALQEKLSKMRAQAEYERLMVQAYKGEYVPESSDWQKWAGATLSAAGTLSGLLGTQGGGSPQNESPAAWARENIKDPFGWND